MKILFICSSNVCRSPFAEIYFKKLVEQEDSLKQKIEWVKSSAVFNQSKKIFPKTREYLLGLGCNKKIVDHFVPTYKSRVLERFEDADLIIGMTTAHKFLTPKKFRSKYSSISQMVLGKYKPVPDPFLIRSQEKYNMEMETLKKYIEVLVEVLKK